MYRTLHKMRRDHALDLFLSLKKVMKDSGQQSEDYLYIFPWGNFGEFTYVLGLLPALRKRFKICLAVKESKFWMASYYPESYDFVIRVPDTYVDLYDELFDISCLAPGCPYVLFTDVLANGRFNSELVVKSNRLTLAESYAFALELPLDTPVMPLSIVNRAPDLMAQRTTMRERGSAYTLLVPTANTITNLASGFWLDFYQYLVAIGANPILDTTFVDWDVGDLKQIKLVTNELVDFVVRDCRAVIGLRSGILDLLGGLTKNLDLKVVALYPITSEVHSAATTGLSVRGVSRHGISIGNCWHSANILDLETDLAFSADDCGAQVAAFLA